MSEPHKGKVRIYVGHKLTNASEAFLTQMDLMIRAIERVFPEDVEILKFVGLGVGTAVDVFERDIHQCVATCDMVIAVIDQESTGLGFEIATALYLYGKPIMVVQQTSLPVSRLILGAVAKNPGSMRHVLLEDFTAIVDHLPGFMQAMGVLERRNPKV